MSANDQRAETIGRFRRDDGGVTNIADVAAGVDKATGAFGDIHTESRYPLIEFNSCYSLSLLRDGPYDPSATTPTIGHTEGSGSITDNPSEYKLSHTGASGDEVLLRTASRGRYMPGATAEAGIGIRLGSLPTSGDITARWGYYDVQNDTEPLNGFCWGYDSNGLFVTRFVNGSREDVSQDVSGKVYQSNWSARPDFLSDNGLDATEGLIFQVRFGYYGYNGVEWIISTSKNWDDPSETYVVHRWSPSKETSIQNTNVNITAQITNSTASDSLDLFIGGRKFIVQGNYRPRSRTPTDKVESAAVSSSLIPLLSFRRKTGFKPVTFQALGADVITTEDIEVQLRVGSDLTGGTNPSWGALDSLQDSETGLESDTAATQVDTATGVLIDRWWINAAGSGSNRVGAGRVGRVIADIPDALPVTFAARSITGTDATVDMIGKLIAEW